MEKTPQNVRSFYSHERTQFRVRKVFRITLELMYTNKFSKSISCFELHGDELSIWNSAIPEVSTVYHQHPRIVYI